MITYRFFEKDSSYDLLSERDSYINSLNAFSCQLLNIASPEYYESILANSVISWDDEEVVTIDNIMHNINKRLRDLELIIDLDIIFCKSLGKESFGLPYTRHNAIVIPTSVIKKVHPQLRLNEDLISHEIFHIISRQFPQIHSSIYNLWSFQKEEGLRRNSLDVIINPDTPYYNYGLFVRHQEDEKFVIPMLSLKDGDYSLENADKYLYVVDNNEWINRDDTNYFNIVNAPSKTNSYHPEEISAEAFSFLIINKEFSLKDKFYSTLKLFFQEKESLTL